MALVLLVDAAGFRFSFFLPTHTAYCKYEALLPNNRSASDEAVLFLCRYVRPLS